MNTPLSTDELSIPGPWRLDDPINAHVLNDHDGYHIIDGEGNGEFMRLTGFIPLDVMRAIAAVPEMLVALRAAEKDLSTFEREVTALLPMAKSLALPLIRAALAKATEADVEEEPKEPDEPPDPDSECYRGGEYAAALAEEQARIQRELSPPTEDYHTAQARLNGGETVYTADSTLTKRELFAAMAMQSYIVARGNQVCAPPPVTTAERAVEYADALLKELAGG